MAPVQAVILGLVQGLTEFLPISSTAHLVVAQAILGLNSPPVELDIVLHLATALATGVVLWPIIKAIDCRQVRLIFVAMVPTGILGLWLNRWDELIFGSVLFTAITLIINGLMLLLPRLMRIKPASLSYSSAAGIGLAQGLAVLPGISRSGATIVAGLLLGLQPESAYNFSFLISLPAILAAQGLHFHEFNWHRAELLNYSLGFITAFVSGYFALMWLRRLVARGRFTAFAVYCLILGTVLLGFKN
jgi:undecaprenyl-diphosphatase